jgi:hypothetical protein
MLTGGGLEPWVRYSYLKLDSAGTEFNLSGGYCYICRKANKDEEERYNAEELNELGVKNEFLKKLLVVNHKIFEIKKK